MGRVNARKRCIWYAKNGLPAITWSAANRTADVVWVKDYKLGQGATQGNFQIAKCLSSG